ncbi:MAG: cupin domain-containing protein [bacterium]|nr:cupin domain-containing protein [bacterium]
MTSNSGQLEPSSVQQITETVQIGEGAIVSRTLMRTDGGSLTAFAFDAGQSLAEHTAPFDALVNVIDGELVVNIDGTDFEVPTGSAILMPGGIPHAVRAPGASKFLLVMLRTPKDKE